MRWIVLILWLAAAPPAQSGKLFQTKSRYNNIVVDESDGVRHLRFDGVTQSSMKIGQPQHLVHDYTQTTMLALGLADVRRMLVVGLGGGSMPTFIRAFDAKVAIDVVEIDPSVRDVAARYFDFHEDDHMKVYVEDGAEFVSRVQQLYDLIILDAYAPDFIPAQLRTAEFFATVKDKLSKGGMLASNVWGPPNPAYESMLKTQRAAFKHLAVVKARNSGNRIFFARETPLDKATLVNTAIALRRKYNYDFDLAEIVERGYLP